MLRDAVRTYRLRCGLSQEDLASRAKVDVKTVRNIEAGRGTPRPATMRMLADALELEAAERRDFYSLASPGPPGPAPEEPGQSGVPAQLPADVCGFTAREAELAQLDQLLHTRPGAVVISAVAGTAGVGKTALAVHWAHRVADRFPDGQLYVNLRGFGPGPSAAPAEAIRGLLDSLGVPGHRMPQSTEAQVALYRSLLSGKRVLVLLDNARDAVQVRPFLPGSCTALVVVTSRNQLTSLVAAEGAHPLRLDLLTAGEARELLAVRLGRARVAAEPEAAGEIVAACARLPLALAIAAARARQTGFSLATIAMELSAAHERLDALDAGDATSQMRAVFSWSYTALSPPAARLFRLLSLHPGPHLSATAAASLGGCALSETCRLLRELTQATLLTQHAPGRYGWHDLLHTYATELVTRHEPESARRAAMTRLLDHYTRTAHEAARLLHPHLDPISLPLCPVTPGSGQEPFACYEEAVAWLGAECPAVLAVQRQAAAQGYDVQSWQLAWALSTFLDRQGRWTQLAEAWQIAVAAADRIADPVARAHARRRLATADIRLGRYARADAHLHEALDLYGEAGDRAGQAHAHDDFALLRERQGRPGAALEHTQHSLDLHRAAGHRRGVASALNNAGWYCAQLGDYSQAVSHCERALDDFQRLRDSEGEAAAWDSLGYAYHHSGRHVEACRCYQRALVLRRSLDDRFNEAETLTHLGDIHDAAGNPAAARSAWQQARDILTDLDHPDADQVRARLARAQRRGLDTADTTGGR
jgi:tetratricopeptide (TPR) repeat protein/transcriptional regulator with XRE-family HTH domain